MKVCKSMLISDVRPEINIPQAAWALQGFATTFYVVFSVIIYAYIGNTVASPALLSLQSKPSYPIPLRRTKNVWVMRDYGRTESAYMRA